MPKWLLRGLHGYHEIDGDCGSHSLDTDEDLNITHFYKILPKTEA